ncbi:hypothetical protein T4B_14628 [Trichinella pseudospiralis]|uniref:Uncharacterized protein n=1 Tax=Trichinella pseudospiralis TaxID=6337 RepID=A0A0V1HXY2_TRIPS|nr:hypothetical protein T4B_14628 [Trichinella pseudospiralis]
MPNSAAAMSAWSNISVEKRKNKRSSQSDVFKLFERGSCQMQFTGFALSSPKSSRAKNTLL